MLKRMIPLALAAALTGGLLAGCPDQMEDNEGGGGGGAVGDTNHDGKIDQGDTEEKYDPIGPAGE